VSLRPDNFAPVYRFGQGLEASTSSNGDLEMSYNNSGSYNGRRDSSVTSNNSE